MNLIHLSFQFHDDINLTDDNSQGPFPQNGSTYQISLNVINEL